MTWSLNSAVCHILNEGKFLLCNGIENSSSSTFLEIKHKIKQIFFFLIELILLKSLFENFKDKFKIDTKIKQIINNCVENDPFRPIGLLQDLDDQELQFFN
ncbi:hypothetical protein BpHYR1_029726 [Brachionus plicatilis]|uniref:Uncharacterized protein n=1 Tax=Brachionus plicatilis TaxID=10195 RepID=A0A3M7QPX2_BRAPC|nr:hypothetical protein BpHYR1_029726 [Brachionus plicatilis]